LWCEILKLIETKEHLTSAGFNRILSIKAAFPRSLNSTLIDKFPNTIPILLPEYKPVLSNLNYFWLAGFIYTDGSFYFSLTRGVTAFISIAQNSKSLILLEAITSFIGCGYVTKINKNGKDTVLEVKISKLSSIIPLLEKFKEYKLQQNI
jgi:hypothetical protein